MAHSVLSICETLHVVYELQKIFSSDYEERKALAALILEIASAQSLFLNLGKVIEKYNQLGESIDQQINFLNQLRRFKTLIEENVKKSTQSHEIILIIEDYLSSIQEDYKLIGNYVQSLDDINKEIETQSHDETNKNTIGGLIIRGVEEKIPNFIYFDQKNSDDDQKKLEIVRKFYDYFIKYVSYVREALENMFSDNNYRSKLESLQSKLLNTKPHDIEDYFIRITRKMSNDRGYSTEILLENLAKNPMVHRNVANNSLFYCNIFLDVFKQSEDKICIASLTNLLFKLDDDSFIELNTNIFESEILIDLVFKSIYNKGIELYSIEPKTVPTSIKDQIINYFKPTAQKNLDKLRKKFQNLFIIMSSVESDILNKLINSVIDEKNAVGTYHVLTDIYGERIKSLDFSDDIINVKYCFNTYFFKSLKYQDLDDVIGFPIFARLLFYIQAYDHEQEVSKTPTEHKDDVFDLKRCFSRTYNDDNHANFNDLVEILKVMINIQSFQFRLDCATSIISELENNEKN